MIKPVLIQDAVYLAEPREDSEWSNKNIHIADWNNEPYGYVIFKGICLMNLSSKAYPAFVFQSIGKQSITLYIREEDLFDFLGDNNE